MIAAAFRRRSIREGDERMGRAIEAHRAYIMEQTLAESFVIGATEGADATGDVEVGDVTLTLTLKRLG